MPDGPTDSHDDRPGERGAAAEAGIVDQQDALLHEMEEEESDQDASSDDA